MRSVEGHQETKPRTLSNATMAEVIRKQTQEKPLTDLDVGDYALVNGSHVDHQPASTYTDATSTSEWPDRIVLGLRNDPVTGAAVTVPEAPATTEEATSSSMPDTSTSASGSVLGTSTSSETPTTDASSSTE